MFIKPFSHKTILLTIHQNKDKNQILNDFFLIYIYEKVFVYEGLIPLLLKRVSIKLRYPAVLPAARRKRRSLSQNEGKQDHVRVSVSSGKRNSDQEAETEQRREQQPGFVGRRERKQPRGVGSPSGNHPRWPSGAVSIFG